MLICFAHEKDAGHARASLEQRIKHSGDEVLDLVVLKVDAKHTAQVHDPRRTLAGALTPALTWGVFGLLAGGVDSLVLWAVAGFICGGVYAYLFEHLLTKDELERIGTALPAESSAIVAFVRGTDPERVLAWASSSQPTGVSVAALTASLSVRLYGGAAQRSDAVTAGSAEGATTPIGASPGITALSMLLVRFSGEHGARKALAGSVSAKHPDPSTPKVELFIEANGHGRRRVIDPTNGSSALSGPDALVWGAFGLVWGAIVGFTGDGGVLRFIDDTVVTGILWTVFGLAAGALYGLWAGRGVSARRLKRIGALIPPDTSIAIAWAEGAVGSEAIQEWAAGASALLALGFDPTDQGAVLRAAAPPSS
ncbi:hypothetical protein SAMN05443544_0824 [Agromyces cerinus subsp. cerinus]|uniref:Uncharacterized protein n=2 Tax=Agromyces cerinus TaxID=33878 RepID=A0A1N6DWN5_9MICO|nr:hypothetical protein SAMN05443544_0824 [Agromyces cerinus subsp. cerinus]